MTPSSLPGLSARARALLAAEREIVAPPPELRWRAQLRARTAFGQRRDGRAAGSLLLRTRKSTRVLLVAALAATSAFAAWRQLAPEPLEAPPAIAVGTAPPPGTAQAPRRPPAAATTSAVVESAVAPSASGGSAPGGSALGKSPAAGAGQGLPARATRTDTARRQAAPSEELTLLDSARRAVMDRNFERALRVIDRHARSFPKSALREEREALRVRALQGAGRSTQANSAAREFESRYPSSVLASELNKGD
ncbi:MAG TPA: hypothetical protein VI197_22660 [Polyangiaceae bacterium]